MYKMTSDPSIHQAVRNPTGVEKEEHGQVGGAIESMNWSIMSWHSAEALIITAVMHLMGAKMSFVWTSSSCRPRDQPEAHPCQYYASRRARSWYPGVEPLAAVAAVGKPFDHRA